MLSSWSELLKQIWKVIFSKGYRAEQVAVYVFDTYHVISLTNPVALERNQRNYLAAYAYVPYVGLWIERETVII